jgi:hypothetical protein
MEAAITSETSVNFYQTTRRNHPEDNYLHIRRRENLKSHHYEALSFIKYRVSINYSPHSHSTHIAFSFTVVIVPLVDRLRNKEKMS